MIATAYLPIESEEKAHYNELYIDIHGCFGLEKLLTEDGRFLKYFVIYNFVVSTAFLIENLCEFIVILSR